jgi:hypothetical protein
MSSRNTNTLPAARSKLDKPHVMSTIRNIIVGEFSPTVEEQELILAHLLTCQTCQIDFEQLVALTLDDSIHNLLSQLKQAHQLNQERDELIAAYAEEIEVNGIELAKKRFRGFSLHLEHCEVCKEEVEEIRSALKEAEQDGLIAPLRKSEEA